MMIILLMTNLSSSQLENVEVVAILSYLKKPEQIRLKTSIKR